MCDENGRGRLSGCRSPTKCAAPLNIRSAGGNCYSCFFLAAIVRLESCGVETPNEHTHIHYREKTLERSFCLFTFCRASAGGYASQRNSTYKGSALQISSRKCLLDLRHSQLVVAILCNISHPREGLIPALLDNLQVPHLRVWGRWGGGRRREGWY